MLIPAFFVYLNYFQPLGIFLFRSFYALICQIIPGQFLPGKIFFLPDVLILFLGRKPAADVPLLFVFLQHLFDLFIQLGTDLFEPLGHIFMYRALGNGKAPCRLADGGVLLDDVLRQPHSPFFR